MDFGARLAVLGSGRFGFRAGRGVGFAVQRAGSGTLVFLFAHVEHAALNPPAVLFLPVRAPGPWRGVITLQLTHTHPQGGPVVLGQQVLLM